MLWFCTYREQVNKSKFILFFSLKTVLTILVSQPNKSLNNIQRVMLTYIILCFCDDVFISSGGKHFRKK